MNDLSFALINVGMFLFGYASCWIVDFILKGTDMISPHIEDDFPNYPSGFYGEKNLDDVPDDFDGSLNPHEYIYDRD